jgi:hypothetical protein
MDIPKIDNELKKLIPKRNPDAAFRVIDGEAIVVLPDRGEVKVLNDVGSRIWELMDGESSVDQISQKICKEYEVKEKDALNDISDFLAQLSTNGMLALE